MALGLRGPELTAMDTVAEELKLATELRLRTSVHIESGGTRRPIADLCEHGLLRDTTTFVHANGIGDDELRMLADAGCSVSISPDVELKMGMGWPMTGRMRPAAASASAVRTSASDSSALTGAPGSRVTRCACASSALTGAKLPLAMPNGQKRPPAPSNSNAAIGKSIVLIAIPI